MKGKYKIGKHLIIDFFDAINLQNLFLIEKGLTEAAEATGATIIDRKVHQFGEGSGITGFILLAESHISIHTWPEYNFAGIDILTCGSCNGLMAIKPLKQIFQPKKTDIRELERGAI